MMKISAHVFRFRPAGLLAMILLMGGRAAGAASMHLAWSPIPDADLGGYRIYYGTSPGSYTKVADTGRLTDVMVTGLSDCTRYFFAAKAYDSSGNHSLVFSNEIAGLPSPLVTAVSPTSAERGQSLTVTITGLNIDQGARVVFPGRISVSSTTYVSCNQVRATIAVAGDASLSSQTVSVVNPDGSSAALAQAFQVLPMTVPQVVGVSPGPGARGIPVTVSPSVFFSERMNPLNITPATVRLLAPNGAPVAQAAGSPRLDATGRIATLTISPALALGTVYRLQIMGGALGVRDAQGAPMVTTIQYNSGFLTAESSSTPQPPSVISTTPGISLMDAPLATRPSVTFNTPMDPKTLTPEHVLLIGPGGSPVAQAEGSCEVDLARRVVTIHPARPLDPASIYSIFVLGGDGGVRDLQGVPMARGFEQTPGFTTVMTADTAAPYVVATEPENGATLVPIEAAPVVMFSEPIDPASISAQNLVLRGPQDQPVEQAPGSPALDPSGRKAILTPARPLRWSTIYRIQVPAGDEGVRDLGGNRLDGPGAQSVGFTTVHPLQPEPLTVLVVNPAEGDGDAPRDVRPSVTFNAELDPASVTVHAVRIVGDDGREVPQASGSPLLEANGTTVTVAPADAFTGGLAYHIQVLGGAEGVLSVDGMPMIGAFIQARGFRIQPGDRQGPSVVGADPGEGEKRVRRDVRPRVFFDQPVDPDSVGLLSVVLIGPGGTVVEQAEGSPTLDESGLAAKITPAEPLAKGTVYRVQVLGGPAGVKGSGGNPLWRPYVARDGFETKGHAADQGDDDDESASSDDD